MSVLDEKEKLRKSVLQELAKQSQLTRRKKSEAITRKLRDDIEFQKSDTLMFYVPLSKEVDTMPLLREALRQGRRVAVPYVNRKTQSIAPVEIHDPDRELVRGTYGILEPRGAKDALKLHLIDLVLVPGIAFDRSNHRLGRGKGYYDRFLKTLEPRTKRYGLAFDFQLFDSIPADESDECVDRVITNM